MNFSAVIVAAGKSERFISDENYSGLNEKLKPKTLIEWAGKALFLHTIEALCKAIDFEEIALVIRPEQEAFIHSELSKLPENLQSKIILANGGKRRQDSVRNGLLSLSKKVDRVAVHDAARPFVTQEFLKRVFKSSSSVEALIPVIPIQETVKQIDSNAVVSRTHDRSSLVRVQTPQIFSYAALSKLHTELAESEKEFTDDSMMFELQGLPVQTCLGCTQNVKVTTPEDLVSRGILKSNV